MTRPSRFQLRFDGRSYAVAVDGRDVSEHIAAVEVHAAPHDLPQVVLHLRPTGSWPTELGLLGQVAVQAAPEPGGPATAAFLAALDPLEVERAALARMDLENVPGGGTAAVLRQLTEWARGA